jgi:uncharacterized membrane protein
MKRFFQVFFVVMLIAAFFAVPVFAQGLAQDEQPLDLTGALQAAGQFVLGSLAIAAAATFVTNTFKSAGLVTDTQAITWVSTINFILIIAVFLLKLFAPTFDLGIIEKVADGIAKQGPGFILPLMPLLVAFSKWIHGAVKGAKWIGTSNSLKLAAAKK